MGWLRGGVNYRVRLDGFQQVQNSRPVADVHLMMGESFAQGLDQSLLVPAGISLGAEKDRPLVVIHAMDLPAVPGEMDNNLRADETGRSCD